MTKQEFIERIQEPSTKRGIVLLLTTVGCKVSPEHIEAIVTIGGLFISGIAIFTSDKK